MKTIRVEKFGGPEVMQMLEVADLDPGPRDVVVKLHAAGINPVDTYIRGAINGERSLPYTPGQDGAGVVIKVGREVPPQIQGKRVYLSNAGSGTYAEQVSVPFYHVHPLADHLSFAQGAAIFVAYTTAFQALFLRGRSSPGETVLIHGASGGVGLAALQWARSHGVRVLGTAGTEEGLRLIEQQGAHLAFNHHASDFEKQIHDVTEGLGPNLIVEMLANVNLQRDLQMISARGRVVIVGNRGSLDFNPRAAMGKEADVLGMSMMNLTLEELMKVQHAIHAGIEARYLNPVVSRCFTLEQAAEAHKAILEPGTLGKLYFKLD